MNIKMQDCSMCRGTFEVTPEQRAFCPTCVAQIQTDATSAEDHLTRLNRGDLNVVTENEEERKRVRAGIRRRLSGRPDCRYSKP